MTSAERSAGLPDLPTFQESGVPDYDVTTWHGWLGPRGLPVDVVRILNVELNKVLKMPDVAARVTADGAATIGGSPEVFRKHILSEVTNFKRLAKMAGIKPIKAGSE